MMRLPSSCQKLLQVKVGVVVEVFTSSVARVGFVDKPRMQALGQTGLP